MNYLPISVCLVVLYPNDKALKVTASGTLKLKQKEYRYVSNKASDETGGETSEETRGQINMACVESKIFVFDRHYTFSINPNLQQTWYD